MGVGNDLISLKQTRLLRGLYATKERGRGECVALESREFERSKGDSMLVNKVLENMICLTNNYNIMKKFKEYDTRKLDSPLTNEELNQWSEDGWELVGFSATPDTRMIRSVDTWFYYIFAREYGVVEKKEKVFDETSDFIEKIYQIYPSKCPMRGSSLGKCTKDKERIKKLLKTYTEEQIEFIVKKEVEDKYGKNYMQNFSTFLNNFPDPSYIEVPVSTPTESKDTICINGQIYR
jgi:hypothetical protein